MRLLSAGGSAAAGPGSGCLAPGLAQEGRPLARGHDFFTQTAPFLGVFHNFQGIIAGAPPFGWGLSAHPLARQSRTAAFCG